ncbi:MAG: SBBP repeat-containing protein [Planctomycetota bacterium]
MKFFYTSLFLLTLFTGYGSSHSTSDAQVKSGAMELSFIENKGQVDRQAAFYARTLSGTVFVTHTGEMVYSLPQMTDDRRVEDRVIVEQLHEGEIKQVRGEVALRTTLNYFLDADESGWHREIPAFRTVSLGEVYPRIRVTLKARDNNVEKRFTVLPGGDPKIIRMDVAGAGSLSVDAAGELVLETVHGDLRFTRPEAYQEIEGKIIVVDAAYKVRGNSYSFSLGAYDRNHALIIDPLLASTFLGGSGNDYASSIRVAPNGDVYVSGDCSHTSFPSTPGAYDPVFNNNRDAFIARFDPQLTTLLSATFIGGAGNEFGDSMAMDGNGNIYLAGETNSYNFPSVAGAYDPSLNGNTDLYVVKLDANLSTLMAATFIGGTKKDGRANMALNSEGDVIVSGHSVSTDFPTTPGAYCETFNGGATLFGEGGDLTISVLDPGLTVLKASSYVGGSGCDISRNLGLGQGDEVYLVGLTASNDFPTSLDAYDTTFHGGGLHGGDAFVSKLSKDLSSLQASTYLGSSGDDWAITLTLDAQGHVYVAGDAFASDFPTTSGAYDTTFHGGMYGDVFISRFDSNLTTLAASTFLGGAGGEYGASLLFDDNGDLYVAGMTQSSDFPTTPGAFDESYNGGDRDFYIAKLTHDLDDLLISTFAGGEGFEWGQITLDAQGTIYASGATDSADFPTAAGAYDRTYNGSAGAWGGDVFVSCFDKNLSGSLHADAYAFSESAGGRIQFTLDAASAHAGRAYLLIGSASGVEPGSPLPGGHVTLPLNWDGFTEMILALLNTQVFTSFYGTLDQEGKGTAWLNAPVISGYAGWKLDFAFALNNPFDFVSNPISIEIEP